MISEYDRRAHDDAWLGRLSARHAYHATSATLAEQGFHIADETVMQVCPPLSSLPKTMSIGQTGPAGAASSRAALTSGVTPPLPGLRS